LKQGTFRSGSIDSEAPSPRRYGEGLSLAEKGSLNVLIQGAEVLTTKLGGGGRGFSGCEERIEKNLHHGVRKSQGVTLPKTV